MYDYAYIYIYYTHTLYTYIGWSENMVPLNPLVKHNFLYQNGDFLGYTGTSHSQTRPYSCSALPRILCIDPKNERTSTLHAVYFPYHVTMYIHCVYHISMYCKDLRRFPQTRPGHIGIYKQKPT